MYDLSDIPNLETGLKELAEEIRCKIREITLLSTENCPSMSTKQIKNLRMEKSIALTYMLENFTYVRKTLKQCRCYQSYIKEAERKQEKVKIFLHSSGSFSQNRIMYFVNKKVHLSNASDFKRYTKYMYNVNKGINANPLLTNYDVQLKGSSNASHAFNSFSLQNKVIAPYIKGCNYAKANELILSANEQFFKIPGTNAYDYKLINRWTLDTMKYLESQYPNGQLIWARLHVSEGVPHIHALVTCLEYSHAKDGFVIANEKVFGTKEKIRELRKNYTNCLQRNGFIIGNAIALKKNKSKKIDKVNVKVINKEEQIQNEKRKALSAAYNYYSEVFDSNKSRELGIAKNLLIHKYKLDPELVEEIQTSNNIFSTETQKNKKTIKAYEKLLCDVNPWKYKSNTLDEELTEKQKMKQERLAQERKEAVYEDFRKSVELDMVETTLKKEQSLYLAI